MKRAIALHLSVLFALHTAACRNANPRNAEVSKGETDSRLVTPGTVLPQRFAAGWAPAGSEKIFVGKDLYNRINGAAELFLEMGFRRNVVQRYRCGEVAIDLEVYEMESPTAALGLYFHKRGHETPLEGLAGRHTGNRFQITACKGKYFFQVNNFTGDRDGLTAMTELARSVFRAIPEGEPVELLAILPRDGLVADSELIVRGPHSLQTLCYLGEGDVLELDGRVFGIAGDYVTSEGDRLTRLVIPYGESAAAVSAYRNLLTHLDPYLTVVRQDERELLFRDIKDECGQVKVTGDRLELRLHLSCTSAASPGG
jgi:hypothetical protein